FVSVLFGFFHSLHNGCVIASFPLILFRISDVLLGLTKVFDDVGNLTGFVSVNICKTFVSRMLEAIGHDIEKTANLLEGHFPFVVMHLLASLAYFPGREDSVCTDSDGL